MTAVAQWAGHHPAETDRSPDRFWSGYMSGFQARAPAGDVQEATN